MTASMSQCLMQMVQTDYQIADYQSDITPRWCTGCGDNAILTAMQRLCGMNSYRLKRPFVSRASAAHPACPIT